MEHPRQGGDLFPGCQWFGAAHGERRAVVSGFGEHGRGDGGDVGGVDGRDRHIGPGRPYDVALPELR
jgi:hypothetical protein